MTRVNHVQRCRSPQPGQTTTEYAMIVAAVIVALVTLYSAAGALIDSIVSGVLPLFG